jgi:hypothetical protein
MTGAPMRKNSAMHAIAQLVHSCSTWDGYIFDPGTYIRAVNSLHSGARPEVLAGLRAYREMLDALPGSRVANSTRLFLLLRVLFMPDDPRGEFPRMCIGAPDDVAPAVSDIGRLYPLVLVQEVPLLIVPGFTLAGDPEDPLAHLEFCERHCQLRATPLRPPASPLHLADALLASAAWHRPDAWRQRDQAILRAQLLRLVRPAYDAPGVDEAAFFEQLEQPGAWDEHLSKCKSLNLVWDATANRYACGDA